MSAPYSLQTGASVLAKVVAYNAIGDSPESAVGNGALVMMSFVPGPPVLTKNVAVSTKTQIGVQWTNAANNGGQPIIDYRVSYDQGTNGLSYIVVASGI